MGIRATVLANMIPLFPCESLLSLSYPDMVMSQEELEAITGWRAEKETDFGQWHRRDHPLPDTEEVFSRLGVRTVRYVDIVASRGVEEIVDLNRPCELGQHDVVLDAGTTEHCANIWQATVNAAHAVKPGGFIIHTPPLSMLNHGFYCPQPTFYADLYEQNGWEVVGLYGTDFNEYLNVPYFQRFKCIGGLSLYVIARRRDDRPLNYPTQRKYLKNPRLA